MSQTRTTIDAEEVFDATKVCIHKNDGPVPTRHIEQRLGFHKRAIRKKLNEHPDIEAIKGFDSERGRAGRLWRIDE